MAPVVYTDDDNRMDQKELYFEASVLHRIPAELLVQSSSSTPYCQSFPNGKILRTWLSTRKKNRSEERLRRIAKFHAELMGKSIDDESSSWSSNTRRISNEQPNDKENNNTDDRSQSDDMDRNELLLDINLKTMVLLHHNQDLQRKLNALARETRNLVRSCRSNTSSSKSEPVNSESAN